jgi:hypothetical protein
MLRKLTFVALVIALSSVGVISRASASTPVSLLVDQSIAFSVIGHSCGGIQEQAFATGFDATSGFPTGAVYVQTRCGGSGRGGGYHVTTYSAWLTVTWDFTGAVVTYAKASSAPAVDPTFAAFDAHNNEIYNASNHAYLVLDPSFTPQPRLLGMSATYGPAGGGTSVTITGTGFTGVTAVDFGTTAASFVFNSDTSITAVSPTTAAGTVDVSVTTAGGTSAASASDQFTFYALPTVTNLSPSSGPVTGGTNVIITGTGFTTTTSVNFGGQPSYWFTVDSDTQIEVTTPAGENPDNTNVTVTTLGGTSAPSNASSFTYTAAAPPGCAGSCISIGDTSMLEGDTTTHAMTFPVMLSGPSTSKVTVQFATSAITATGGPGAGTGVDYQTKHGTLTFTPVAATGLTPVIKWVSVPIYGDTTVEGDETFAVTLSNPTGGYDVGRAVGTGTILDDDPASGATLGIGDGSIAVASSGTETLKLPVTLSQPATGTVSVPYTVTPFTAAYSATAAGGGNFGGKLSGKIVFTLGSSIRTISVPIWPGASPPFDSTFTVNLSTPSSSSVTLIRDTGTGTVLAAS